MEFNIQVWIHTVAWVDETGIVIRNFKNQTEAEDFFWDRIYEATGKMEKDHTDIFYAEKDAFARGAPVGYWIHVRHIKISAEERADV